MPKTFKIGEHVRWNSEAGRVSGSIKKITSDMKFKGYVHHASREAPQYLIKSDKTEHVAIHKGAPAATPAITSPVLSMTVQSWRIAC